MILRKLVSSVVSRLHPQLCGIERFVGKLKSAGAGFFAGVPVKFTCGCPFGIPDVARPPRPCRKGEGALATSCLATTF